MLYKSVCLESLAHVLPPNKVTSLEVEQKIAPLYKKLKLSEGRLELMSGVRERRLWNEGTLPSHGAILAGKKAIQESEVEPAKIGALVHGSISKDCMEPATASIVHKGVGLSPNCQLFDLSNACLGFINATVLVANMIELGQIEAGLIVASECAEELYRGTFNVLLSDPNMDRKQLKLHFASMTTGSGAVAAVLTKESISKNKHRLLGGVIQNATEHNNLCVGDSSKQVKGISMKTDSELLLHRGCELAGRTWDSFKKELDWTNDTPDRVFTHQVGQAHQKLLFETVGLDMTKDFETLSILGNVGSVSLPASFSIGSREKPIQAGEKIALLGIGSGLNSCMLAFEW